MIYHDITWHFVKKENIIFVKRNYNIFVAKIYDCALIVSFWGSAGFLDSPTSSATLVELCTKLCDHFHYFFAVLKDHIHRRLFFFWFFYWTIAGLFCLFMLLLTLDEGLAEASLSQFRVFETPIFFLPFSFSSDGHQEYFGLLTTGAGCTWPGFSLWQCPRSQKTQDKWANLTSANGHTPPYWNLHHHRHDYFGNKHTTNLSSLLQIL